MDTILSTLGLIVLAVGVVLWIFRATRHASGTTDKELRPLSVLKSVLLILGICLFLFGASFTIVPTGYTGVRTTFGQISDKSVPQGFNLKIPFIQTVELVNNKQQDITINTQVWGETVEKTPVYASDVIVTYQINGQKSAWLYANVTDCNHLVDQYLVSSAVKSAMVTLKADEVTSRTVIEPLVKEELQTSMDEKYGTDSIRILKVVVNNMDFEESYNEAISKKSIAQREQERQAILNQTEIDKAAADKQVQITRAEAEGEALLIKAQAEADANRILAESISDKVLKNKFYEVWDGQLPDVWGAGSVITDVSDIVNQTAETE